MDDIMIETCVRIIMITLITVVVSYYAYLLGKSTFLIKKIRLNPTSENLKQSTLLKKKFFYTVCYSLCMAFIGLLYFIGIDVIIIMWILIILNVIIGFVGDKIILSISDFKIKQCVKTT